MTTFLYDIAIRAYSLGIRMAAPFNEKAALLSKGRKASRRQLQSLPEKQGRLVWFHAASLGEFEQGRPVIESLKQAEPGTRILLTFFSPSGYEIRKNYPLADYILYLPADTRRNARQLIGKFRPDAAVFIKYEYWYHYLHELHQRQIPLYLISGIFRPEQPFFRRWGGLHRRMLSYFSRLFVQDQLSADLLASIGIRTAERAGDTRFDRVKQIATDSRELDLVKAFCNGQPAVVCGSTWPPDEDLLLDYINRYSGPWKWIIAPHETGENHIRNILEKCRKKAVRYTQAGKELADYDVLLIDCIGLLSAVYRYGKVAYIGGGFGVGIHNTLEAAVYGIPVIFGPNYRKFKEACDLIEQGGAFSITKREELNGLLDSLLSSAAVTRTAGEKAAAYVESQLGATEKCVEAITGGLRPDER